MSACGQHPATRIGGRVSLCSRDKRTQITELRDCNDTPLHTMAVVLSTPASS